jgi:hypothetical protein
MNHPESNTSRARRQWGRLVTCGGLSTRSRRRFTTGAQDTILPHRSGNPIP